MRDLFFSHLAENECLELRILEPNGAPGVASGYFRDPAKMMAEAHRYTKAGGNAYLTINPAKLDLAARTGLDKAQSKKGTPTTSDKDITRRTHILLDLDFQRPAGIPASDQDLQSALDLATYIEATLADEGWPTPTIINSGNGAHLLYAVDLPNTPESLALVKSVLAWAQQRFCSPDGTGVQIDQTVANAARISRIPGTLNRKGAGTDQRPHRMASVIQAAHRVPVSPTILDAFRAPVDPRQGQEAQRPSKSSERPKRANEEATGRKFDIEEFVRQNLPEAVGPIPYEGGRKWQLRTCPWNPEHTNNSGYVIERADGKLAAGCLHNSCAHRSWSDLREMFDPASLRKSRRVEPVATGPSKAHRAQEEAGAGEGPLGPVNPLKWASKRYEANPELNDFELTDLGNAFALAHLYGHKLRWHSDAREWLVWVGTHWQADNDEALEYANKTALRRKAAAWEIEDEKCRKTAINYHTSCQNSSRRDAMLSQFKSWRPSRVKSKHLDQDQWLLNCQNGTVDLRTGHIRENRQDDLITMCLDIDYDPGAKCPMWQELLHHGLGGDQDVIAYLQRAVGYSLTGEIGEQVSFWLEGDGKNGKSTFLAVLCQILSSYTCQLNATSLSVAQENAIRNDIADIYNKRLIQVSELPKNFELDEALLKRLVGGDLIKARRLYQEHFEFAATGKLWFLTNHLPNISGTDDGIWRRIVRINWPGKFEAADPDMPKKLLDNEAEGILTWAVQGCLDWQRQGLDKPIRIISDSEQYRSDCDVLAFFVHSECVADKTGTVTSGEFFDRFAAFCKRYNHKPLSHRECGMWLKKHFETVLVGRSRTRAYEGIRLA